jgi:hypothetical protein
LRGVTEIWSAAVGFVEREGAATSWRISQRDLDVCSSELVAIDAQERARIVRANCDDKRVTVDICLLDSVSIE